VEGRSDVLNLLKYGIKNTIAVEGVNVPKTVADLTKERAVAAFLDGDRGGDLILKELLQIGDIDYVTRAPRGQEVEYLNKDQVIYALKNKTSVDKIIQHANYNHNQHNYHTKAQKVDNSERNVRYNKNFSNNNKNSDLTDITTESKKKIETDTFEEFQLNTVKTNNEEEVESAVYNAETEKPAKKQNKYLTLLEDIKGTGKGNLLDEEFNTIKEVKVENLYNEIKNSENDIKTVIFDGIISQRLVDLSKEKNIECLVAVKMSGVVKKPETIKIITK
jgi:DNA primase